MPLTPAYPVVFTDLTTIDGLSYRGGYCTTAEVKQLFINMDNYSKIASNTAFLETVIADTAADMDRALEPYYVTPISGSNALQHVNYINKFMAAGSIVDLMAINSEVNPDSALKAAVVLTERGSQRLDDIALGETVLFDAVAKGGGEKPVFPKGKGATWNPEADFGPLQVQPETSGPLFGTRRNPSNRTSDWIT